MGLSSRNIDFTFDAEKELKARKDSWGDSLWDRALLNPALDEWDLQHWPTKYRVKVCDVPGIEQYISPRWELYLTPEVRYDSVSNKWDNRQMTGTEKAVDDWSDEQWISWAIEALCYHIVDDARGKGK